jgi:uncharacterized protein
MLAVSECERGRQAAGAPALDQRLAMLAKAKGIPVVGLETIEGQLGAFAGLPEDQQIGMVKAALFHAERTADQMETLLQLYLRRQLGFAMPFQKELARQAGVEERAFAGFESELVVRRNRSMAENSMPLLAQGGVFIGVGGLHLVGDTGLVALLRAAGYTVTAIE